MSMIRYRIVEERMGGWKWGYPRGHRRSLVCYGVMVARDGRLLWESWGRSIRDLTSVNYAEAERRADGYGSIHHRPLTSAECSRYAEQQATQVAV